VRGPARERTKIKHPEVPVAASGCRDWTEANGSFGTDKFKSKANLVYLMFTFLGIFDKTESHHVLYPSNNPTNSFPASDLSTLITHPKT
jgi:hypothetical protein